MKILRFREKFMHSMLWQVASLIVVLFCVSIVANGILIYRSQYKIYEGFSRQNVEKLLQYTRNVMNEYRSLPWLLDYWKENASSMETELPKDEEFEQWRKDHIDWYLKEARNVTCEEAEGFTESDKLVFAEYCYIELQREYDRLIDTYWVGDLQCFSMESEDEAYMYIKGRISEEKDLDYLYYVGIPKSEWLPYEEYAKPYLGEKIQLHPDTQKALLKTYQTGEDQSGYDIFNMFGADYMMMYLPIVSDDEVIAVVCASDTIESIKTTFWQKLWTVETANLVIHVLIGVLLLGQINLIAMRPIRDLRKSLHHYIKTQDSETVIDELTQIKSHNEVGFVAKDIIELAKSVDSYVEHIVQMTGEHERIEAELEVAERIQNGILPKSFPDHERFSIFASMSAAKEVGGDMYDFFYIGEDRLGLVIADVSGKGVPGAFMMAVTRTMIRNSMITGKLTPSEVLSVVNNGICEYNPEMMFVTAWVGVLELDTFKLTCANAGHECPIIRRGNGKYEIYKDEHDIPLGIMEDIPYKEYELNLGKKDAVFVYSDGLPDAINVDEEQFGEERILEVLNNKPFATPHYILGQMEHAVTKFVGEAEQFDDLTMLCIVGK